MAGLSSAGRRTGLVPLSARFPAGPPPPPESRLEVQRPAAPLARPSSPAQPLQLVHGDRQVGDRRQTSRGWRAEQRFHDGLRRGRGAAGEEQAAAVRGLRAQFHGGARPPRAPALSSSASASASVRPPGPAPPAPASAARPAAGARGSNTNTTPRFRDAAAAGKRRGRAGVQTRQAPATCTGDSPSPREASGRAGASNLKIKSKQTRPVEKRERPGPQGNGLGSHCLRFSLFFFFARTRGRGAPSGPSPPFRAVAAEVAFRGNSFSLGTSAAPPPFPSWRQTESTNQQATSPPRTRMAATLGQ